MASVDQQEKQQSKKFDQEVRDMVSAIMSRVSGSQKPGSLTSQDEDERGVRVITLAGNNLGASLQTDKKDGEKSRTIQPDGLSFGDDDTQSDALTTYVNSNFQAINNSIMMGGTYEANDPGVHMDISDFVEQNQGQFKNYKHGKKGKKGKKEKEKEKEAASSDKDSETS